jgi:hypothetical protein
MRRTFVGHWRRGRFWLQSPVVPGSPQCRGTKTARRGGRGVHRASASSARRRRRGSWTVKELRTKWMGGK